MGNDVHHGVLMRRVAGLARGRLVHGLAPPELAALLEGAVEVDADIAAPRVAREARGRQRGHAKDEPHQDAVVKKRRTIRKP